MEKLTANRVASTIAAVRAVGLGILQELVFVSSAASPVLKTGPKKRTPTMRGKDEREQKRAFVQHAAEGCVRPAVDFKKDAELPRQGTCSSLLETRATTEGRGSLYLNEEATASCCALQHNRRGNRNPLKLDWLLRGERQQCFRGDLHTLSLHEYARACACGRSSACANRRAFSAAGNRADDCAKGTHCGGLLGCRGTLGSAVLGYAAGGDRIRLSVDGDFNEFDG